MKYISDDYHDYVFKDGKHIGLYDEMYKYSKEIPWHQDKMAFEWYSQIGILMIRDVVKERGIPFSKILELGSGLGFFVSQLEPYGDKLYGCDVSATAAEKARKLHKSVDFFCWDICKEQESRETYELVIMVEVMWYVLDHLENIKNNVLSLIPNGGFFLFKQSFPDLKTSFLGKEIFPNPKSILDFWNDLEIINYCETKRLLEGDGPHIWFLGRKPI